MKYIIQTPVLIFDSFIFHPVIYEGRPWITAVELSKALGYGNARQVSRIYARNEDVFRPSMSQVVQMTVFEHNRQKPVRIFSLPGCRLIAALSGSPLARKFRRWALDIPDWEISNQPGVLPSSVNPISPVQQRKIQKIIAERARAATISDKRKIQKLLYRALNERYQIKTYKQLPAWQFEDAICFLATCSTDVESEAASSAVTPSKDGTPRHLWAYFPEILLKILAVLLNYWYWFIRF